MTGDLLMNAREPGLRAQTNPKCVVCGAENTGGLRLQFRACEPGVVEAQWTPSVEWEGFRGIVHGGVVSTVLDEAMSKAIAGMHCEALTAELRVRFHKPVNSGTTLAVRGWVCHKAKRRVETEATLLEPNGSILAHAWATFLELKR